jgi:hypothetical protein
VFPCFGGHSDAAPVATDWLPGVLANCAGGVTQLECVTKMGAFVASILACFVAMVVLAAWMLSLFLATELATDAVDDLSVQAEQWAPTPGVLSTQPSESTNNSWYHMVQQPALELANTTLPSLSAWSTALSSTCVCFWLYAGLSLPLAVALLRSTAELSFVERYCMAVTVGIAATLPIYLLAAPAGVSTATNQMLDQINTLSVGTSGQVADQCECVRYCLSICQSTQHSNRLTIHYCCSAGTQLAVTQS